MPDASVLLIEGSDYATFPAGGQFAMARCLMKIFGDTLALVGMTRGEEPIGQWTRKEISGCSFWFFPVCRRELSARRPLVPARLQFHIGLRRFKKEIQAFGCRSAFIQAPEAVMAVSRWNWDSLCFWFPGVESNLKLSRYGYARPLAPLFDKLLFSALDPVNVILAAADEEAIGKLVARSNGRLTRQRVIQLPTCVDTSEFHPAPMDVARASVGIAPNRTVFVNHGRIGRFKGWELLIDALDLYRRKDPNALLLFVGDGEDGPPLQASIDARNLGSHVKITGFQKPNQVKAYLNAANVAVYGSFVEGWSAAMLEAIACGKPIVSTDVSGVKSMVVEGKNGFVVNTRNPAAFADAMERAVHLPDPEQISTSIAAGFNLAQQREKLTRLWAPFGGAGADRDITINHPAWTRSKNMTGSAAAS